MAIGDGSLYASTRRNPGARQEQGNVNQFFMDPVTMGRKAMLVEFFTVITRKRDDGLIGDS